MRLGFFVGVQDFLQGGVKLLAEVGTAADEEASHFAVGVDNDRLRNGGDGIFFGGSTVLIEHDVGFEVQAFEQAVDGFGIFLHVNGDELDVIGCETVDGFVNLGHGGDAGAAPGGEKVEDDNVAFVVAELEWVAVECFQGEIGRGLADQCAIGAGRMVRRIVGV